MVWFTLLLLLVSFIPSLIQAYVVYAQSPDEVSETIVKNDQLDVSTLVKQVDDQMLWEIKYQLNSPAPNIKQRLKFKIYQGELVETNLAAPENIEGWGYGNDNWFMPENFSQTTQGSIFVKTDLSVEQLVLKLQIDEEVTTETILATMAEDSEEPAPQETVEEVVVTENVLEAPISNPHQLSAPTVKVQVTQTPESAPMIEESAVATEEPEISTDAPVVEMPSSESEEGSQDESDTDIIVKNTTESSQEESSSEEETTKEESTEEEEAIGAIQNFSYNMGIMPFAVSPYVDPFAYTPDGGQYPTHGTDRYPATNTTSSTNANIKNYNYASNTDATSGTPPVKNVLSETLDFNKGYHAYQVTNSPAQDIYLKKVVMPTDDPTKFKVQLDMIGGYLETRRNVDVVFVVDKSGSMAGSNWTALKNSLNTFANGLLGSTNNADGAVRLGLASFGGVQSENTWQAFGEIGNFGGTVGNYIGFTTSASAFLNHDILSVTPIGGTPTFLGLDAGLELLTNTNNAYNFREDAEKVLIILTDGLPTYAPTSTYTGIRQTGNNASNRMTRSTPSGTTGIERFTAGSNLFTGDGSSTPQSTRTAIINHANNRKNTYPNIDRYAIGFNVSNVSDILAALGPKGQYSAMSQSDLTTVMNTIRQKITDISSLIYQANVFDPMSTYVTLNPNTVATSALRVNLTSTRTMTVIPSTAPNYPSYASAVVVDKTGNKVNLSNLTLSGNSSQLDGFLVEYEVTLKEEYQDGKFYPTNGPTYLADDHYADPFGFAVPSVKAPVLKFNIPVTKEWIDDNNDWSTRQSITLQLQKRVGTGSTWQNVTGKSVVLAVGTTSYTFTDIPAYESGIKIDYRIQETPTRVQGYKAPVYTPASVNVSTTGDKTLKVTNELLKTKVEFTKVKSDGTTPLVGVSFTLYKADGTTPIGSQVLSDTTGKVSFPTQIPIGSYVVKETLTPLGYEPVADMNLTVTDTNAVLSVNGLPTGNKVVNHLKDFKLVLTKLDNHGNAVNGAKFLLTSTTTSPPYSQELTSTTNVFEFTGLKPGTYTLTETTTPDGFIGIENPITIMIDIDGNVTIDGSVQNGVITANGNIITLDVINRQKGQLPSTGGQGTNQFMWTTVILIALAGVVGSYYVYRNKKGAKVK